MLYIGLAVGLVLGSFVTVISMAMFKEVAMEQNSGASSQVVKHGNDRIKREDSPHSATSL